MQDEQFKTIKSLRVRNAKYQADIANKDSVLRSVGDEMDNLNAVTQLALSVSGILDGTREEMDEHLSTFKQYYEKQDRELKEKIKT